MSLLNVGNENEVVVVDESIAMLDEEVTFGAFEAGVVESSELVAGYESLVNTAEALEDTLEQDMVGKESNSITPDSVQRQLSEMKHVLALGIDETSEVVKIGSESINKDPLQALEVGKEAKEGMIKEIIRKAKEFVKMIINSIKKYAAKIGGAIKTLTMNVSKLKDMAEDNEDDFKLDPKEDAKVHNRFRDIVGIYGDAGDNMKIIASIEEAVALCYNEPTSKHADLMLNHIKNGTMPTDFLNNTDIQAISKGAKLPATSSVRALLDKTQTGAGSIFGTAGSIIVHVLTKSGTGKKEKWKVNSATSAISTKSKTYNFTYTAADIKNIATNVANTLDKYPVQEVINAVYDRLDILDKYISDETKTSKKQTVSKMMKYAAWANKTGSTSIKTTIANQKTLYSVLKLMVQEAGN